MLAVVAVPENVTEAGRNLQEVFWGSPEQENCSVPEKPEATATLKLSVAVPALVSASVELPAANISTGMDVEVDAEKLPSPPYCALSETSPLGNDVNEMLALPALSVPVPSSVCPA